MGMGRRMISTFIEGDSHFRIFRVARERPFPGSFPFFGVPEIPGEELPFGSAAARMFLVENPQARRTEPVTTKRDSVGDTVSVERAYLEALEEFAGAFRLRHVTFNTPVADVRMDVSPDELGRRLARLRELRPKPPDAIAVLRGTLAEINAILSEHPGAGAPANEAYMFANTATSVFERLKRQIFEALKAHDAKGDDA